MFWKLARPRKPQDCGVWQDGKQIMEYVDMMDEGLATVKSTSINELKVQP